MQELTPVGLSKDEKNLVLISSRGVEFSVALDQKLRDALRGDQNRLGQLEMKMESTLRPKDIQSRIRSGESAEDVAEAANSSVDKIMIYAGPVLAERAHVAQSAQLASIRRKSADSSASARTLSDAAPPYFRAGGTRPDDVEWDAWRRDDGRWTVIALFQYDGEPQRAEFTYDMPGRYVVADNEPARQITGEGGPAPAAPARSGGRRLSAVPNQDQLPLGDDLGDDVLAMVREGDSLTADHADADWMGSGPDHSTTADHEITEEISLREEAADVAPPAEQPNWLDDSDAAGNDDADESAADATVEPPADHTGSDETADPAAAAEEPEAKPAARPKKRGRAQVPSWDEIMFGSGKGD